MPAALLDEGLELVAALLSGQQVDHHGADGVGGRQILLEDPSGNPVELFEPLIPEARNA